MFYSSTACFCLTTQKKINVKRKQKFLIKLKCLSTSSCGKNYFFKKTGSKLKLCHLAVVIVSFKLHLDLICKSSGVISNVRFRTRATIKQTHVMYTRTVLIAYRVAFER